MRRANPDSSIQMMQIFWIIRVLLQPNLLRKALSFWGVGSLDELESNIEHDKAIRISSEQF
jgi:hypothetical protein